MWTVILEKAWAKVKGNYNIANEGLIPDGIRTLTGAPVRIFGINKIGTDSGDAWTASEAHTFMKECDSANLIMGAATLSGSD